MKQITRLAVGVVLTLTGLQHTAFAQEDTSSKNEFQQLLEQIQEEKKEDKPESSSTHTHVPGLDLPAPPAPNTPPVFPEIDGTPKPLPWLGLQASPAFQKTPQGVGHDLSGMLCNDNVGKFQLNRLEQINVIGETVSCGYKNINGQSAITTVLTRRSNNSGYAAQLERMRDARLERDPSKSVLAFGPTTLNAGRNKVECGLINFAAPNNDLLNRESIAICLLGGWQIIFSMGSDSDNSDTATDAFLAAFIADQVHAVNKSVLCKTFISKLANEEPSGATGLSYHADGFAYSETGPSCYAGHTNDEQGGILIRYWPENPDTPMTADHISANGQFQATPTFRIQDMWASVAPEDRGPAGYLLMREQADGTITVYNGYSRIPSDARFYQDANQAYAGGTDPLMLAKQNEHGGWTMAAQ